jgi:PAS domain-containing protein
MSSRTANLVQSEQILGVGAASQTDRAQRYLDTAAVVFLALNSHGRITLVNDYACVFLGWTATELLIRDTPCSRRRLTPCVRRILSILSASRRCYAPGCGTATGGDGEGLRGKING